MLNDEEFKKKFYAESTHLRKIKLAIQENRYIIWSRPGEPNLSEDYLQPILALPDRHEVIAKKRKSGGAGAGYIVELKYTYSGMGISIPIYMKGYYSQEGLLELGFEIQSLKEDSD